MSDGGPQPTDVPQPASPAPGQGNQRPPVITVPTPQYRDPNDPLDPQRLAMEELTVRQVLQEADSLIAVARPAAYGQYRGLTGQVEAYYRTFRNNSAWAEYDFKRATLFMNELSAIPATTVNDLLTRDEARKAVGESWRQWWTIYNNFVALARRYAILAGIKDDLIAGINRPPSDAPPLA